MDRLKQRIGLARAALDSLDELARKATRNKVERDAAVQRFEYSFEAVWKAVPLYLREVEGVEAGSSNTDDDLRPECDLKSLGRGVRGKYARRASKTVNVVTIDDDLVEPFPDAKAVNDALHTVPQRRRKAPKRREIGLGAH